MLLLSSSRALKTEKLQVGCEADNETPGADNEPKRVVGARRNGCSPPSELRARQSCTRSHSHPTLLLWKLPAPPLLLISLPPL